MEKRDWLFDVCIICALYEEAEAVLNEFSTRCNVSFSKEFSSMDRYEYRYTSISNHRGEPLTVLVTWLSDSGPTQAALDLKPFLHEFRPRFVAMTGFCAGYKKKVKLGDLVVAQYAYFYEVGKVISDSEGLLHRLQEIKAAASTSQVLHYTKGFNAWKEPVKKMKCDKLKRQLKESEEPRCVIAPMASGMAVRQDDPFPWLREHYDRGTAGLDMEAATFYQALRAVPHIHGLVVKGVCDHADMNKKDTYHDYAARASAIYLLTFIQEYVTEQTMPRQDRSLPSNQEGPSRIWNIPHTRNPHFTGRDDLLNQLHQQLTLIEQSDATKTRSAALTQSQAIKGLGGIGKTQIAVEYAYRCRDLDRYIHTIWINAATEQALISSFAAIAELLPSFFVEDKTDQQKLIKAVKDWLEKCEQSWLLIFDNADDLSLLHDKFPQQGNGSILLTTRAHAVGEIGTASIEVEKMGLIEGTKFLLRRAQRLDLASDEKWNEAMNLVTALDYFPLALDQAGAYIEETGCSFTEYLQLYQQHRKDLLTIRGKPSTNYPETVATTWSLSFEKVENAYPAAADLLRFCAFLDPDAIPQELVLLYYADADSFMFNQAIKELFKFSLIKRFGDRRTLTIHRLVQAVLIDSMEPAIQRQWAEQVLLSVNDIFPNPDEIILWPTCLRYLPQVQACYTLVNQYQLIFIEAAHLLNQASIYLRHHGLYTIANPLILQALNIYEQELGPEHPDTAAILNNLAGLYENLGKYEEAEPLYQRALAIYELHLGLDHPETASILNNLAGLYENLGKYEEAESLYLRALAICERHLGPEHLDTATSLDNLAGFYESLGKYGEAEPLYLRALSIYKQQLGPEHPETATSLNNLALFYHQQGKYSEAESLYQQALMIREQHLGKEHHETATSLNNLAGLYENQGKYEKAKVLYERALAIYEQQLGSEHPKTQTIRENYLSLLQDMKQIKDET